MIQPSPRWEVTARYSLTRRYGRVNLLPDRVLGQWFCLDRSTGERLWERWHFRPEYVSGVSGGVIVASEECGIYGISLDTGRLLWTSHGSGLWGHFLRLLDFIPFFDNDLRDVPHEVVGNECICVSGRVIDLQTGRTLRRIPPEEIKPRERTEMFPDMPIGDGSVLSIRSGNSPNYFIRGKLRLRLVGNDGTEKWKFDVASTGKHFQGYRYCSPSENRCPFVYLMFSNEPNSKPHPTKQHFALPNSTSYHLLALDVIEGQIVQDVPLGEAKRGCGVADADENGLLISMDGKRLRYFERVIG